MHCSFLKKNEKIEIYKWYLHDNVKLFKISESTLVVVKILNVSLNYVSYIVYS